MVLIVTGKLNVPDLTQGLRNINPRDDLQVLFCPKTSPKVNLYVVTLMELPLMKQKPLGIIQMFNHLKQLHHLFLQGPITQHFGIVTKIQ